jgi:TetR/AcrR family transcriptional repressor of nem operon
MSCPEQQFLSDILMKPKQRQVVADATRAPRQQKRAWGRLDSQGPRGASAPPASRAPLRPEDTHARPYADVLRERQREGVEKRKGERTRDSLKLAAVEALDRAGYHKLTVAAICKRAGASHAAFYLYFKDKNDITHQVLTEFMDEVIAQARFGDRGATAYDSIYHTNLLWLRTTKANAGLVRCVLQLSDDTQQFKEFREMTDSRWFAHVARGIARRWLGDRMDERTLLLRVYALGSMMDEFIRRMLVSRDPYLQTLVDDAAPTEEALAEFLTTLWYRSLFGVDAPAPGR